MCGVLNLGVRMLLALTIMYEYCRFSGKSHVIKWGNTVVINDEILAFLLRMRDVAHLQYFA